MPAPTLSVQLYTVREALAEDFDGTLAKIAGFGFDTVEPFGFDGFADELREGLPKHGLSAPTAHVGLLRGDAGRDPRPRRRARHQHRDRPGRHRRTLGERRRHRRRSPSS